MSLCRLPFLEPIHPQEEQVKIWVRVWFSIIGRVITDAIVGLVFLVLVRSRFKGPPNVIVAQVLANWLVWQLTLGQKWWRASRRLPRLCSPTVVYIAGTISLVTRPCSSVSSSITENAAEMRSGVSMTIVTVGTCLPS